MSRLWVILEVKGNPEPQPGGNYYHSLKRDKQICVRDTDIVQVVELSKFDRSPAYYRKQWEDYDKKIVAAMTDGSTPERIERLQAFRQRLSDALVDTLQADERVAEQRWQYGVEVDGRFYQIDTSNRDYFANQGRKVVRRPVGEWVDYEPAT